MGKPCYTFNNKNVVLIHGFKNYCALLFHKAVLLKDDAKIPIQQTQNVQSARQLRFKNIKEIKSHVFLRSNVKISFFGKMRLLNSKIFTFKIQTYAH